MYSDEDGITSKESQSEYNVRIRILVSLTTLLSWLGLGIAVADGNYPREYLPFDFCLTQLHWSTWSIILWASCFPMNQCFCFLGYG